MNFHRTATRSALAAIAAVALGSALTVGSSSAASAQWTYLDLIVDGRFDSAGIDSSGDGYYDQIWSDVDGNSTYDIAFYDTNFDGYFEWLYAVGNGQAWLYDGNGDGAYEYIVADLDGNGLFESAYYDTNFDGFFEWVQIDAAPVDGVVDTWTANMAGTSSGSSGGYGSSTEGTIDAVTENIVTMGMMDDLADAIAWTPPI